MESRKTLFDDEIINDAYAGESERDSNINREVQPLDRLKNLEEKITAAVEKVKALKEDKSILERKIKDLETLLNERDHEIESLRKEKNSIGSQLEELLSELETLEV